MNPPPELQPASAEQIADSLVEYVRNGLMDQDAAIDFVMTSCRSQLAAMIANEQNELVRARVSQWRTCGDRNLLMGDEPELEKYRSAIDSFRRVAADLERRLSD